MSLPCASHELTIGLTLAVAFDHGEDFFPTLAAFCRDNDLRQGYIPTHRLARNH